MYGQRWARTRQYHNTHARLLAAQAEALSAKLKAAEEKGAKATQASYNVQVCSILDAPSISVGHQDISSPICRG